jgi:hypothetical protein
VLRRDQVFIVTGHEVVNADGSYHGRAHWDAMYHLIQDHPNIFSGFYHYENAELLKMKQRLDRYHAARRTPARNQYDR